MTKLNSIKKGKEGRKRSEPEVRSATHRSWSMSGSAAVALMARANKEKRVRKVAAMELSDLANFRSRLRMNERRGRQY